MSAYKRCRRDMAAQIRTVNNIYIVITATRDDKQRWSSWLWRGFNTAEVGGSIPPLCTCSFLSFSPQRCSSFASLGGGEGSVWLCGPCGGLPWSNFVCELISYATKPHSIFLWKLLHSIHYLTCRSSLHKLCHKEPHRVQGCIARIESLYKLALLSSETLVW